MFMTVLKDRITPSLSIVLTGVLAVSMTSPANAKELTGSSFKLPSKNIECQAWDDDLDHALRCDMHSPMRPMPKGDCDLDWTGLTMGKSSKAVPTCAGDTVAGDHPILNYGDTWRFKNYTCKSERVGLTCTNGNKHGFFMSRERWKAY